MLIYYGDKMMGRKGTEEIIKQIFELLEQNEGNKPIKRADMGYVIRSTGQTTHRFLELIRWIQSKPKIKIYWTPVGRMLVNLEKKVP